jgi:hypothetical protein
MRVQALPLTRPRGQSCHHLKSDLSLNCVPRRRMPVDWPVPSNPTRQASAFMTMLTSLSRERRRSKQRTRADIAEFFFTNDWKDWIV